MFGETASVAWSRAMAALAIAGLAGAILIGCTGNGISVTDPASGDDSSSATAAPSPDTAVRAMFARAEDVLAIPFRSPAIATMPAALNVEAWRQVAGFETADITSCAEGNDGFTTCILAGSGGRAARLGYRTADSSASAEFECEARAGTAAGNTLSLEQGFTRWTTGDEVLVATNELCFSTQLLLGGQVDPAETLRVASALGAQADAVASDQQAIAP